MFYKGIFGELAAMLRGPTCVVDFEKWGCNYWKDWADEDGSLRVDYGNAWLDYNGVNQLETLINTLKNNPMDRRMLITSWRPDKLDSLSLPCCHHTYQWYVRKGEYLDMKWEQRSADTMIGIPSDIVLAAVWNIMIANEVGLKPGRINMTFGDTHIYEEHWENAQVYIDRVLSGNNPLHPLYMVHCMKGVKTTEFQPDFVKLCGYTPMEAIKFELKA
jgi:thymidylate synthase